MECFRCNDCRSKFFHYMAAAAIRSHNDNTPEWYASYAGPDYDLSGAALKKHWAGLHAGNLERFPISAKVRKAWQAYH